MPKFVPLAIRRRHATFDAKPVETEYGENTLAALAHYPTPQALVDTYINGLFVLRKNSHSDYLTGSIEPL